MVYERYTINEQKFHHLQITDNIKNKHYGLFDRFEKNQLNNLCHDLNIENQTAQDYEDFVKNTIINMINNERTKIGQNVLIQLAETLGIEEYE